MVKQLKDLRQMRSLVKKGEYFGDFVIVNGVRYQIVEYSMEGTSKTKGSRWITFFSPYARIQQLNLDYEDGSVTILRKSIVDWEHDMGLDLKWLKGGKK